MELVNQFLSMVQTMLSNGQIGALLICVSCIYVAFKVASGAIKICAIGITVLALLYIIDPAFHAMIVQMGVSFLQGVERFALEISGV